MKSSFSITVFSETVGVSGTLPLQPPYLLLFSPSPFFVFTPKLPVRATCEVKAKANMKRVTSSVKRCLFIVAIPQSHLASGLHGTLPPVVRWQPWHVPRFIQETQIIS